eukprot:scaffold5359_cov131-Isochrysis_galbana.AAC.9
MPNSLPAAIVVVDSDAELSRAASAGEECSGCLSGLGQQTGYRLCAVCCCCENARMRMAFSWRAAQLWAGGPPP